MARIPAGRPRSGCGVFFEGHFTRSRNRGIGRFQKHPGERTVRVAGLQSHRLGLLPSPELPTLDPNVQRRSGIQPALFGSDERIGLQLLSEGTMGRSSGLPPKKHQAKSQHPPGDGKIPGDGARRGNRHEDQRPDQTGAGFDPEGKIPRGAGASAGSPE